MTNCQKNSRKQNASLERRISGTADQKEFTLPSAILQYCYWLAWIERNEWTRERGSKQLVPVVGKMKEVAVVVRKICFTSSMTDLESLGKAGERWSSLLRFMARRMGSGTLVGPGTNKWLRPGAG
jgi:hypothetical protein